MAVKYKELMADFWKLPALLNGVRHGMEGTEPLQAVKDIWGREGWDMGEAQSVYYLCMHEISMAFPQVMDNEIVLDQGGYDMLRAGLGDFTRQYSKAMILKLIHRMPRQARILDYCGGNGTYLQMLYETDKTIDHGVLMDRDPGASSKIDPDYNPYLVKADFKADPDWWVDVRDNGFDIVMLNEVLHCQGTESGNFEYLLESSFDLLAVGGSLIIGERQPTLEFQWRMEAATSDGGCIDIGSLLQFIKSWGLQNPGYAFSNVSLFIQNETHYWLECKK